MIECSDRLLGLAGDLCRAKPRGGLFGSITQPLAGKFPTSGNIILLDCECIAMLDWFR